MRVHQQLPELPSEIQHHPEHRGRSHGLLQDIDDIRNSFHKFAQNTAADGVLILNAAIDHPEEITADLKERVVTFGLTEDADYTAADITYNEAACASFTFQVHGQAAGHVTLNVPGRHNIANALAAIAFATEAGIDTDTIIRGLQAFGGTAEDSNTKENSAASPSSMITHIIRQRSPQH